MGQILTRRRLSQRARHGLRRGGVILGIALYVAAFVGLVVVSFVTLTHLMPVWVADWQGAHGSYPTGHLTYTVPERWNTTTLRGLGSVGTGAWWGAFDDRVTATSPTYIDCFSKTCSASDDAGARVDLESGAYSGHPTLDAWYQTWANTVAQQYGSTRLVLPLADYTHMPIGGQPALCAANRAGSEMLPPYPPAGPDVDTVYPGYSGQAWVLCFALWQGRAYAVEGSVQLHTASQEIDLPALAQLLESLRFT